MKYLWILTVRTAGGHTATVHDTITAAPGVTRTSVLATAKHAAGYKLGVRPDALSVLLFSVDRDDLDAADERAVARSAREEEMAELATESAMLAKLTPGQRRGVDCYTCAGEISTGEPDEHGIVLAGRQMFVHVDRAVCERNLGGAA